MWQVGLRISWLTQGLPTLSWPPTPEPSPPKLVPFLVLQEKQLLKDSPKHFFVAKMDTFSHQFLVVPECSTPLLGRDILTKLGTTLVMGSFSSPRALQLLVTTEGPITPSIERDQKLWDDKINPQVWDQGIPGRAHQAEPVIIVLRDPTRFPNQKQYLPGSSPGGSREFKAGTASARSGNNCLIKR